MPAEQPQTKYYKSLVELPTETLRLVQNDITFIINERADEATLERLADKIEVIQRRRKTAAATAARKEKARVQTEPEPETLEAEEGEGE